MSNLIKVIFEYSDGTKKYIDQDELEKWLTFNALVASAAHNHRMNPPWESIKWKKIGQDKKY